MCTNTNIYVLEALNIIAYSRLNNENSMFKANNECSIIKAYLTPDCVGAVHRPENRTEKNEPGIGFAPA